MIKWGDINAENGYLNASGDTTVSHQTIPEGFHDPVLAARIIERLTAEKDKLELDYAIELAHSAGLVAQLEALREERTLDIAS